MDPIREATFRRLHDVPGIAVWVIGDSWVKFDNGEWFLDADNPVSDELVVELLERAGGVAERCV